MEIKKIVFFAVGAIIGITCLSFAGSTFEVVDTGHRGVKVSFGEVDEKAGSLPEGLYFMNPFTTKIVEIDTRQQKWSDKVNTYTKDVQQGDISFTVLYHLDPNHAHTAYKTIGRQWDTVVAQAVVGPLKQVIGQYDAVDLIKLRAKATSEVRDVVAAKLAQSGVVLDTIELVNIQYNKEFEKAVEDKVVAVQRATQEQNKTVQVQEQAKQAIISAGAQAESMRIRATALASNPKLVEYEAVQKWDGKLPQYSLGGATPFINLNGTK
jgi:regulator of protease activity HflC (stomatin/prohibitin superfamily)